MPPGRPTGRTVSLNVMDILENVKKGATVFEKYRQTFSYLWSHKRPRHLNSMNVKILLELHMSAQGTIMRKSLMIHSDAGLGFFSWTIRRGEVVGYYNNSLVYAKQSNE